MKKIFLAALLLTSVSGFAHRDVAQEIRDIPERSGGIYYAYPFTTDSMAPAPAGYEPVYLSHYGRHGSRWIINDRLYPKLLRVLSSQRIEGNLTPLGVEIEKQVKRGESLVAGHFGELSKIGERQHKAIADRMYTRFEPLFKSARKVEARSSTEQRCIISMAAFSEQLRTRRPDLNVCRHATPSDMRIIAPNSEDARSLGKESSDWQRNFKTVRDSLTRSGVTAARIFRDPSKVKHLSEVMRMIFDVAVSVQDVENLDIDIISVFDPSELADQWKSANYMMYVRYADSSVGRNYGPMSAVPLLQDIIEHADSALAGGETTIDLRFGHDTALLKMISLMGLTPDEGLAVRPDFTPADVAPYWQTYNLSPMAANVQLAFLRNASGNIIVAPRLNERPASIIGLKHVSGHPGYYNWDELRRVWKSSVSPVAALIERVSPGASHRFVFEQTDEHGDFFEISQIDGKPLIRGNNPVNIAAGLNWYLKYYANTHLSWNNMTAELPAVLPLPGKTERHDTDLARRYYLNYCTHSYSMAFWDWERWQREIDWMALHGINMPLAMTGMDVVWRNTLKRLGYTDKECDEFVAGPAFQAWWLMNNLEGWGGPMTSKWYDDRADLQRAIVARMREFGMEPVLPGYSGMVPHDAAERLGVQAYGTGEWNGFTRPAFLRTDDPKFDLIADIYYDELTRLCGVSKYYSMDPFHEGGSTEGVDLTGAGSIINSAMKRVNPDAVWVIQGWNENPREELLRGVPKGDIVVLDLASEIKPNWGDPESPSLTKRADGYGAHDWMWCMLLNFGGNVGLHGRMDNVIEGFYKARDSKWNESLTGYGLTPEGIENNPMMYELASELIWRPARFSKHDWLGSYARARYGLNDRNIDAAWKLLSETIYNCPWGNMQQGTTESVFCARPSDEVWQVSSWSRMAPYYNPEDVIKAAKQFGKGIKKLGGNANYVYDLVDITRQAIAEKGRLTYNKMIAALKKNDMKSFGIESDRFLNLILEQDSLLSYLPDFTIGKWCDDARNLGAKGTDAANNELNARYIVTTWGPRVASEQGGLRDYAHREWSGLLREVYYPRWQKWIEAGKKGDNTPIDFFELDHAWVTGGPTQATSTVPQPDPKNLIKYVQSLLNSL